MEQNKQHFQRRLGALKNERSSFIPTWKDLSEFILPRQARFFVTDRNKGDRRSSKINNITATLAARTLSAGMKGGLTSPSRPWFQLRTPDPELNEFQPVKEWLDLVRQRMSEFFLSSNLYTTLSLVYADLGVFGSSAFALMEDEEDALRCYYFPVGSYMMGASHRGNIDSFYREYELTASQMVGRFGRKNCSKAVQDAYDKGSYDQPFPVVHAVEPNANHDPKKLDSRFKAWRSVYYEAGGHGDQLLSDSGFDEFPLMCPRWEVNGEDIYGTGHPGDVALGGVKALQLEEKRKMEFVAKGVNPPMSAPDTMRNAAASVLPGNITYIPGQQQGDSFRPVYQVDARFIQPLGEMIAKEEQLINEAFFKNLFLMLEQFDAGKMTATEVAERQQEKMLLLGPVLERLNDELFDPLIDRAFNILEKRKLLPPPPPEIQGQILGAEYVSILAQAQKLQGISGVERLVSFTGSLMAADPTVIDNLDLDEGVRTMGGMLGTPPKLIRDKDTVDKMRAQRQQMQQSQQALAMAQQGAETAKVMSETNVTDPNALTTLVNQFRGGA